MSATAEVTAAPASAKARAILDAAAELFITQGYGAVSMDAVAKRASVSKATLYAHFGAKDRLFAAIIQSACLDMRGETPEMGPAGANLSDASLFDAMLPMAIRWLSFLLRERSLGMYRVVVAEGARFPELARAFHENGPRATRQWLTGWLAAQAARGLLQAPDPALAADQCLALLRSEMFLQATLGIGPLPDEAAIAASAAAAVRTFCRAYGAAG
jgi:TetR/AcrR family transcriptional repressor of mexJK operon